MNGQPRESSAHVTASGGGTPSVRHHRTQVEVIGGKADDALQVALAGDPARAAAMIRPVRTLGPEPGSKNYFRGHNGQIIETDATKMTPVWVQRQLVDGGLHQLSDEEIRDHLEGR